MIDTEWEHEPVQQTSDELSILETFEPHKIVVTSPKRVEKILILKTSPRFIMYKVLYDSGKPVPGLEGSYTNAKQALDAVKTFLSHAKQSKTAQYKDRWGDEPVPELKTKRRVVKKKVSDDNSNEGNQDN